MSISNKANRVQNQSSGQRGEDLRVEARNRGTQDRELESERLHSHAEKQDSRARERTERIRGCRVQIKHDHHQSPARQQESSKDRPGA